MNLSNTLSLYGFGTGAVGIKKHHDAVISKPMHERGGHTQVTHEMAIKHVSQKSVKVEHPFHKKAPHHAPHASGGHMGKKMFSEADAPELTDWEMKRQREKQMGRNMDPFEADYENQMYGKAEVTGPCGCTLKLGEKVLVEKHGQGIIMHRSNRILTVALDGDGSIQIDQRHVHRPR